MARAAVTQFAGMELGRPVGGTYYLYRTLRNLDLDGMMDRLMEEAQERSDSDMTPLQERLEARTRKSNRRPKARDRSRNKTQIGRRSVWKQWLKHCGSRCPKTLISCTRREKKWRTFAKPYNPTRKLAARLARKRKHKRKGPLDFRATVRQSLSYGGVPAEPRFRNPRPNKPELCRCRRYLGLSGSFARFTLHLVYALQTN